MGEVPNPDHKTTPIVGLGQKSYLSDQLHNPRFIFASLVGFSKDWLKSISALNFMDDCSQEGRTKRTIKTKCRCIVLCRKKNLSFVTNKKGPKGPFLLQLEISQRI